MRRRKGKRARTGTQQAGELAAVFELNETIQPSVTLIARPGDGGDILAVILRNRDADTYTLRMRFRNADGRRGLSPEMQWLPAENDGPPQEWLDTLAALEKQVTSIGGMVTRLTFPKDASSEEVLRIFAESGEVNFPASAGAVWH